MKKKCLFLIILIFISLQIVVGRSWHADWSRGVKIQAGYGKILSISVLPIPSQSQNYLIGMPFNIEDPLVQFSEKEHGRRIANWSLIANTDFYMTVEAKSLSHESDTSVFLPYILTFEYSLGYYEGEAVKQTPVQSVFIETTGDANVAAKDFQLLPDVPINKSYYMGTNDGHIYFKFTKDVTASTLESLPAGNYYADVTIKLISRE